MISTSLTPSLPELTAEQQQAVLYAAAEILAARVQRRAEQIADPTLAGAARMSVMGSFVTARTGKDLRGCCGFLGAETPLLPAVRRAARRTACEDPRFPPIAAAELDGLNLDVWLLMEPQPVAVRGEARRDAFVIGRHGLQIVHGSRHGLLLPGVAVDHGLDAEQFLQHTCLKAGLPPHAWLDDEVQLFTFAGCSIKGSMPPEVVERNGSTITSVREPAVAGRFYPADPAALRRQVDQLLALAPQNGQPVERRPFPAIMVPHAGLKYSGRVAADVFRRVEFPETAIIIGPKHTPYGADWAVAPHVAWSIPGATINGDLPLARQLAATLPGLELDADAHAHEHAIEVELPFLAQLAPQMKIVGIAVGTADYDDCRRFARGLAQVLRSRPERTLLVISSDMNHFASDAENRRLDDLALSCIDRLDPAGLLATCRNEPVTMCGVLPAVIVMETLRELGLLQGSRRIAYATSADASGDTSRVVGYAGMAFEAASAA